MMPLVFPKSESENSPIMIFSRILRTFHFMSVKTFYEMLMIFPLLSYITFTHVICYLALKEIYYLYIYLPKMNFYINVSYFAFYTIIIMSKADN